MQRIIAKWFTVGQEIDIVEVDARNRPTLSPLNPVNAFPNQTCKGSKLDEDLIVDDVPIDLAFDLAIFEVLYAGRHG